MRIPNLFHVIVASCLAFACGPASEGRADTDPPKPPGMAVPTHVLTEDRAETTVEVEAGDKIEVHLRETDGRMQWAQQGEPGLALLGPCAGELQDSKEGPVRVFRYQTRGIGETSLSFALTDPSSDAAPARTVSFTVNVL